MFSAYFSAIRSPIERQLAGGFTIEVGLSRALLGFATFSRKMIFDTFDKTIFV